MAAKEQHMIIMVGIAGSGKSTWAQEYALKNGYVVVSTDRLREEQFGNANVLGNWDFIAGLARMMIHTHFEMGRKVIVDATNLTAERRQMWIDLANQFGVPYSLHVIRCSPMRAWWNQRKRDRKVPFNVLVRMHRQLDV